MFAFDSSAVPYSTGGGVLLFEDKDPALVAETVAAVLGDPALLQAQLDRQKRALEEVDPARVLGTLMEHLRKLENA